MRKGYYRQINVQIGRKNAFSPNVSIISTEKDLLCFNSNTICHSRLVVVCLCWNVLNLFDCLSKCMHSKNITNIMVIVIGL